MSYVGNAVAPVACEVSQVTISALLCSFRGRLGRDRRGLGYPGSSPQFG